MNAMRIPFSMHQDAVLSLGALSFRRTPAQFTGQENASARRQFFLARNAIFHGLRALKISHGAGILVPAYICKAAIEPIIAFGAEPIFYEVRPDCVPEIGDIESKLSRGAEALLAVHYFGFPQNVALLRSFCDEHNLKLIEDCAHVLTGEANGHPLGTVGDMSVFSWRKFLPLYDGGELLLNFEPQDFEVEWLPESALFTARVIKRILDQSAEHAGGTWSKMLSNSWLVPIRMWQRFKQANSKPEEMTPESRSASLDRALLNQPMSRASRWLLSHSDREQVKKVRQRNYRFLESELRSLPGITPLHQDLPSTVCPWVFPVFFDGLANGHVALRKRGIPAVAWEGVRPDGVCSRDFPGADFLYENLTFLPVHQSLSQNDLGRIVEAVKALLGTRS